jgi:hypothetical protein
MTYKQEPETAEQYNADGTADEKFTLQEARKIKIAIIVSIVWVLLLVILHATGHLPQFMEDGKY